MSDLDWRDRDETCYLLPARPAKVLLNNLKQFMRRPGRYLAALWLSLSHRNPGARSLLYALFYFMEGMLLAEHIEARGIQHLHNHFANAASHPAMVAAQYLGIGLSLTLHGLCDFDYPAGPLLGRKIEASSFVVCATQYGVAQAMRLAAPADWDKLSVVRCGIDLDKLPPRTPRNRQAHQRKLRLICVGRLAPEKGQLGLIQAFAQAVRGGLDADLVLVGDGPERRAVEERIRAEGLEGCVSLLGMLPEPRTLEEISTSDVLVLASFMEGLPVVLMEALGMEVPVIAPVVAGIPELVVHGETGLQFAAGDWHQLAERMLEIARDPGLRAQLGRAGRRRIEESFDVNRAVRPLLELFALSAPEPETDALEPAVTVEKAASARDEAA